MRGEALRANLVVGGIVATIVLLGMGIFIQAAINDTNDRQDIDIKKALYAVRESQYRACIINGNTLRDQVRREFIDLKRKVLIPTFAGIAATLPPGTTSGAILDGQAAYLQHRIKTIKERIPDVRCLHIYPPLPGQTFPDIGRPGNRSSGEHPRREGNAAPHDAGSRKPPANTGSNISPTLNGGDTQTSAPPAPQQPAPGDGGDTTVVVPPPDTNPPDHTPPDNTPPSTTPPADHSILGPVVDGTCDAVNNLGVALC